MSETSQRPTLLTVLCILSFISAGITALFVLLVLVAAGALASNAALAPYLSQVAAGGTIYMILTIVLAGASFYGVLQMWKLKKLGFFIYAGANVVALIVPLIFGAGFSIVGAGLTALFVGLYYMNVKSMT